jgi:hypothetical protein
MSNWISSPMFESSGTNLNYFSGLQTLADLGGHGAEGPVGIGQLAWTQQGLLIVQHVRYEHILL